MAQHSCTATMLLGGRVYSGGLDGRNHSVPIHKGGDAADIGNYRGVTLGSHLGKLFLPNFKVKVRKRCGKGRYTGRSARRVQERQTDNRSTFCSE